MCELSIFQTNNSFSCLCSFTYTFVRVICFIHCGMYKTKLTVEQATNFIIDCSLLLGLILDNASSLFFYYYYFMASCVPCTDEPVEAITKQKYEKQHDNEK